MTTKNFSTSATLLLVLFLLSCLAIEGKESDGRQLGRKVQRTANGSACGSSNLNATVKGPGTLHSPNYPQHYPPNSECWWTITAPPDYRVQINFTTFKVETYNDFLQLYDAPSRVEVAQPYMEISSGDVSLGAILSNSNYVTMRFTSDKYGQYKGFDLTYKATAVTCPTLPTPDNGRKTCYVDNDNKFFCKFFCHISNSNRRWCQSNGTWNGNQPTCEKKCFELVVPENGTLSCTNGNNYGSRCNFTCNDGYELFGSESRLCSQKWIGAFYWTGKNTSCQTCGPSNLNATAGRSGTLHSPDYPKHYSSNFQCWWTITAPPGYQVQIKFTSFNLEWGWDFLQLFDAPSRAEATKPYATITYEDVLSGAILSNSNYVTMKFTLDRSLQYEGFDLTYKATAVTCSTLPTLSNREKTCYFDNNNNVFCKFSCNDGFNLFGNERRWCLSNRIWTGNQATCEDRCFELPVPLNGTMRCTDGNYYGSRCNFTCNDGFELFGSDSRRCDKRTYKSEWTDWLYWTGEDTSCQSSLSKPTCNIDRAYICDGYSYCYDQSDEKGCTCPQSKFKCDCYEAGCPTNWKCLPQYKRCNGNNDCGDMSDERDCQCSDTRFQCKDGDCIDRSKVNDGKMDCVNGDDEFICNITQGHIECNCIDNDDERCTFSGRCIPNNWIGDRISDCENHDDEPCNASKVWCDNCWVTINQCSTNQSKNNLMRNSHDIATRCRSIIIPSDQTKILETNWICTTSPCGKCQDVFSCDSGEFTDMHHYCDTIPQCNDGSDEQINGFGFKCSGISRKSDCILPQNNVYDSVAHCSDSSDICFVNGEFRCFSCLDGRLIVSAKQVCDGFIDCYDMSDECLCANQSVCNAVLGEEMSRCPSNQMHCFNDTCMDMDKVLCNSSIDCVNGSNQRFCRNDQQSSGLIRCEAMSLTFVYIYVTAARCDGRPECGRMEDECVDCEPRPSFCDDRCAERASVYLYGNRVCDGYVNYISYAISLCAQEVEKNCPMRFYCKSKDMISIDKRSVCDGIIDCDDHSDEYITSCDMKRFYCTKGNAISIDKAFVCNGIKDCDNGEDEALQMCGENASLFSDQYEMISNPTLRALFWLMGLLALSGNILINIYTAKDVHSCKNQNTVKLANNIFILNLTISDFLMGVYLIAVVAQGKKYSGSYGLVDKEWRSSNLCSGLGTLTVLSSETSAFIMTAMSTFRLLTVYKPFLSSSIKITWIVIAGFSCWIFSFLIAAIPLFPFDSGYFISDVWFSNVLFPTDTVSKSDMSTLAKRVSADNSDIKSWFKAKEIISEAFKYNPIKGEFGYYGETSVCMPRFYASTNEAAWQYSTFLISLNFVMFSYMVIAYFLVHKKVNSMTKYCSLKKDPNKGMQKRISRLLLTDFCCWIPVCIMGYMSVAGVSLPSNAYTVSAWFLLPINSAMNPIFYSKFIGRQASRAKKWMIQKFTCICSRSSNEAIVVARFDARAVDVELRVVESRN